ncbi:unnamed protein product [Amoebophrya sp. A120]|nr:unnamed protein product [Amoebophrya sp. A120]|eukprot:GSA120T00024756001.1
MSDPSAPTLLERVSTKEKKKKSTKDDDDDLDRDWKADYKALKKATSAEQKELKDLKEKYTCPVVTYEDKDKWKEACKVLEREVEEFCERSLKDPGNQFGMKVLVELEEMIATKLHQILMGKHKQFCELKAKEIRTALQAASNAYIERVRDESGFQISKPYPAFNYSVVRHMMLGVFLEITNSKNFRLGAKPEEVLELERKAAKLKNK